MKVNEAGMEVFLNGTSCTRVAYWGQTNFFLSDPKDGELFQNKTKPEEILVEVWMSSNVQIDLKILEKGRKTHRTI